MRKILIVDDSLLDRKLLLNVLEKGGVAHAFIQASDGEEGLQQISENYDDIDLVLLDWQMPNMSGIEFMRALRAVPETAAIPVIMITASGAEDNKKMAYEAKPDLAGYVVKPYKPDDLVTMVKKIVTK